MEMRGIMGGFYKISEWIMRFAAINLLWLICSIPFVLLFYSGMVQAAQSDPQQLIAYFWPPLILMPFTLFPATAAMFTVARKWVMGDVDVPLFKTYFRGYRENYKQSMIGGLFYLLLGVIAIVNFRFYTHMHNMAQVLSVLFIVILALLAVSLFHFFSLMVHVHTKTLQLIKNSLLVTIGKIVTSVTMLVCNGVIAYISFTKFSFFLVVFFMGSVMAYVTFYFFHRMYNKIVDSAAEKAQEEEEPDAVSIEAKRTEDEPLAREAGLAAKSESGQQPPQAASEPEAKPQAKTGDASLTEDEEEKQKKRNALKEMLGNTELDADRFRKY